MPADKSTRRVYSAEELYRLRATCSQPKLSEAIEKNDREDAQLVKEHVLRGTRSLGAASYRSRASGNSLRVPSSSKDETLVQNDENSRPSSTNHAFFKDLEGAASGLNSNLLSTGQFKLRPSPSPSLKKKKAEAIVRAHGSPQHVRVTAGGRIVPSEQSPLCHPRFGYSAIKANGGLIKFAPNHAKDSISQWTPATQNGFVAQDVNGRLCQIVDGTILPLTEVDGALRLYIHAPNLSVDARGLPSGLTSQVDPASSEEKQLIASHSRQVLPFEPSAATQANALQLEYSKIEHELKELDKTEVIHGRTMGKAAKEALFEKRRELVMTLDKVRKAIKSIKSAVPKDAPTSPRAMLNSREMSPNHNRLPGFLRERVLNNEVTTHGTIANGSNSVCRSTGYNQSFGVVHSGPANEQLGFRPNPASNAAAEMLSMGLSNLVLGPPAFDGSMMQNFSQYEDTTASQRPAVQAQLPGYRAGMHDVDQGPPQTDGARSFADLHKTTPANISHAVEIKAPEPKQPATFKSTLNPMSPAYKPGNSTLQIASNGYKLTRNFGDSKTSTPPRQQLSATPDQSRKTAVETADSNNQIAHLNTSSTSSFETADFFPCDTGEYSTRRFTYLDTRRDTGAKENASPVQTQNTSHAIDIPISTNHAPGSTDSRARMAQTTNSAASTKPLKTSVTTTSASLHHESFQDRSCETVCAQPTEDNEKRCFQPVPDRELHNLSPKNKMPEFRFVREHPERLIAQPSSSAPSSQSTRQEVQKPAQDIDFSEASVEWILGYRAGLARKPVGSDRDGDFLDGYCAGLLKTQPKVTNAEISTGSPKKPPSRRPSPAVAIQDLSTAYGQQQATSQPGQLLGNLQQAVYAPQNEDAILTPSAEGPHIDDSAFNLGAWAKRQSAMKMPDMTSKTRTEGMEAATSNSARADTAETVPTANLNLPRPRVLSQDSAVSGLSLPNFPDPPATVHPQSPSSSNIGDKNLRPVNADLSGHRFSSMTSIDANLYRPWSGQRVFSPHLDWTSAHPIAQTASLTSSLFANMQFDGAARTQRAQPRVDNATPQHQSHFREGSIDGFTNPPNSPQPKSPSISPLNSAKSYTEHQKEHKKHSPQKNNSPTKIKFENIAEKVGIKVSGCTRAGDGSSPNSPPGKRRWRDVWRSSSRKDGGVGNEES